MRTCFAGSVSNAGIKLASMPFCERICQPTLRSTERAAPAILQQTGKRDSYQAMASAIAKQYHYPAWRPWGATVTDPRKLRLNWLVFLAGPAGPSLPAIKTNTRRLPFVFLHLARARHGSTPVLPIVRPVLHIARLCYKDRAECLGASLRTLFSFASFAVSFIEILEIRASGSRLL